MFTFLIISLIIGAASVTIALQNIDIITVSIFSWQLTGPVATIILAALLSGIFITTFLILPISVKNYFKYRKLKKENIRLEEELRKQIELTVFAKKVEPTAEIISKIEEGAIDTVSSHPVVA